MNIVNRLKYSGIVIVSMWLIIGSTLANATLQGRLETFSGSGVFLAYYDTTLNTTWLTNANLAASNNFGVSGINAGGAMVWDQAKSWISAMNASTYSSPGSGYLGINTWRLPTLSPVNGGGTFNTTFSFDGSTDIGYNISAAVPGGASAGSTASELANMFYNNLGGVALCKANSSGSCVENANPGLPLTPLTSFQNIVSNSYWSDLQFDATNAWFFSTAFGNQNKLSKTNGYVAWAVISGDVSLVAPDQIIATPIPGAVWLFGSGLLGLVGLGRRKRSQ